MTKKELLKKLKEYKGKEAHAFGVAQKIKNVRLISDNIILIYFEDGAIMNAEIVRIFIGELEDRKDVFLTDYIRAQEQKLKEIEEKK